MIRPDFEKWHQTAEDMRRLSSKPNIPERERLAALYMIGTGQKSASQWAKAIKRQKQTVLGWVHDYNESGPDSVLYQHTGGRQTKLNEAEKKRSLTRSSKISPPIISCRVMAGP
ncbi:MAG: helix-turn-helix domain-containing protein [Anaerolineae bacterium]